MLARYRITCGAGLFFALRQKRPKVDDFCFLAEPLAHRGSPEVKKSALGGNEILWTRNTQKRICTRIVRRQDQLGRSHHQLKHRKADRFFRPLPTVYPHDQTSGFPSVGRYCKSTIQVSDPRSHRHRVKNLGHAIDKLRLVETVMPTHELGDVLSKVFAKVCKGIWLVLKISKF